MLPNRIVFILNFFDFFGYNSGSSKLSPNRKATKFFNFLQVFLSLIFMLGQFHMAFQYAPELPWIDLINQTLQYAIGLYTHIFIVMDSLLQRKNHTKFWATLKLIDRLFACQNNFNIRCFIWKIIEFFSVTTLMMGSMFLSTNAIKVDAALFFYVILIKLCQLRVFYYIFCVDVLNFQLITVDRGLKCLRNSNSTTTHSHRIKYIREYYYLIFKMLTCLNDFFGWSHLATVLFSFYFLLTNLNWFITGLDCSYMNSVGMLFGMLIYGLFFNFTFQSRI